MFNARIDSAVDAAEEVKVAVRRLIAEFPEAPEPMTAADKQMIEDLCAKAVLTSTQAVMDVGNRASLFMNDAFAAVALSLAAKMTEAAMSVVLSQTIKQVQERLREEMAKGERDV